MFDLVYRLILGGLALWAAVEMIRVGESRTQKVRAFITVGFVMSAAFWIGLGVVDPPPESFPPWWTGWSRAPDILIPIGVIAMARRRREINGYH